MSDSPLDLDEPAFRFAPFASDRASVLPSPPYVIGDLLTASATNALSRLADVAIGSVLVSGGVGVAPAWSNIVAIGDGSIVAPAYAFIAEPGSGFFRPQSNTIDVTFNSNSRIRFTTTQLELRSTVTLAWDGSSIGQPTDLQLSRTSAALMKLGGAGAAYGTLDCLGLKASGVAGFNGTQTPVTSITVVNGIVTAVL